MAQSGGAALQDPTQDRSALLAQIGELVMRNRMLADLLEDAARQVDMLRAQLDSREAEAQGVDAECGTGADVGR